MLIGYARTSTIDQEAGLQAQLRDLKAAGAEKIFAEQVSSVAPRAKLERDVEFIREGDTLIVTKLDRLARSVKDLLEIVDKLRKKDAGLKIQAMDLDTTTSHGRLVLQLLGAIAEFERALMLERQIEGIRRAQALGRYQGRVSIYFYFHSWCSERLQRRVLARRGSSVGCDLSSFASKNGCS